MYSDPNINPRILTSVGKVIIAIAWADGEIQHEELECLRSLIAALPGIPPEHVQSMESLLERPIEPTERDIILDEFDRLITGKVERNFALYWLDRIIDAKGTRDPQEMVIYDAIVNRFMQREHAATGASGDTSQPVPLSLGGDVRALDEIEIIFKEARAFLDQDLLSDLNLRRMLMIGALASRITLADFRIDEGEVEQLRDFIRRQTGLDKVHAVKLARLILVRDFESDSEVLTLCRELKKQSTLEERKQWVDQLVRISEQDGKIVDEEMNQIISIAAALEVEQKHFQDALHSVLDKTES